MDDHLNTSSEPSTMIDRMLPQGGRQPVLRLVWGTEPSLADLAAPCTLSRLVLRGVSAASGEFGSASLARLATSLPAGQTLEFRHSIVRTAGSRCYALQVDMLGRLSDAGDVHQSTVEDLSAMLPWLWLQQMPQTKDKPVTQLPWRRTLVPAGVRLWPGKEVSRGGSQRDLPVEWTPYPAKLPSWPLTVPLEGADADQDQIEIIQRVQPFALGVEQMAHVHALMQRVRAGSLRCYQPTSPLAPFCADPDLSEPVRELLQSWLISPRGYTLEVEIAAAQPLSGFALGRIARDVFGEMPYRIQDDPEVGQLDAIWSCAILTEQGAPALLPGKGAARAAGVRQYYGAAASLPASGILIGESAAGPHSAPVRLQASSRTRHTCILGSSGAGKSTLMEAMIAAELVDPDRSCGICVLDPHGELAEGVLSRIPTHRRKDIINIDITDTDFSVCINPLEGMRDNPVLANYIASQFVDIGEMLFENAHSTGPMTQSNFGMLIKLAGRRPGFNGTLLDAVRLIDDMDFRDWLLDRCSGTEEAAYWRRLMKTSGDTGYTNWLPYLHARMVPWTANPKLKRLLCRPNSTVNLRQAMDERKIVVCNFSKSVLQDRECRALGALFLTLLQSAAMSRTRESIAAHPFHVYVDEFQSLVSGSAGRLLAESRKFGMAICCSNQSPSQLGSRSGSDSILNEVLSNTSTKFLFRVGPVDCSSLAPYFRSTVDDEQMARLPDFHAVASITNGSDRVPPFVMRVTPPNQVDSDLDVASIKAEAGLRYGTSIVQANSELMKLYDLPREALAG